MSEYACEDLTRVGARIYSEGRELPGGDVIVPGGISGIIEGGENILIQINKLESRAFFSCFLLKTPYFDSE